MTAHFLGAYFSKADVMGVNSDFKYLMYNITLNSEVSL